MRCMASLSPPALTPAWSPAAPMPACPGAAILAEIDEGPGAGVRAPFAVTPETGTSCGTLRV